MIHAYKMNGYNIILDQNSGCVHSVDDVAYDIITMYEDKSKDEIKAFILDKYKDKEDVNEEEIDFCFNDIDELANSFVASHFLGSSIFDTVRILRDMKKEDVEKVLSESFDPSLYSLSVILPNN